MIDKDERMIEDGEGRMDKNEERNISKEEYSIIYNNMCMYVCMYNNI
jgi:hypothetical protein